MRRMNNGDTDERPALWRRIPLLMLILFTGLALGGCDESVTCVDCDEDVICVDDDPPAVPTGVFSVTGDGVVSVYWNDIYQLDLMGYAVYRHDGDDPIYGEYHWQGDIAWDENYDDDTLLHWFDDESVVNGRTYYYAVLAYDDSGNESALSFETVMDTPRPEGIEIFLYDREGTYSERSGFDFSGLALGRTSWDAPEADIYVTFASGVPEVVAARPAIVQLQDFGTAFMDDATYAPDHGWSELGRAELIEGHCYFVRIAEDPETEVNYAKFRVFAIHDQDDMVEIDWAYQTDLFNRELAAPDDATDRDGARMDIVRF